MRKSLRKFTAYTAAGRAFAIWTGTLLRAVKEAEATKEPGEEILAVVDASCAPGSAAEAPAGEEKPFFAILLWNKRYAPPEEPA